MINTIPTMSAIFTAGNKGEKVRSDCFVLLEQKSSGGIHIELISKVKALYGKDIEALTLNMLDHFGIGNVNVVIEDSGALPFVLAARIEAAIREMKEVDQPWLFPVSEETGTLPQGTVFVFPVFIFPETILR